MSLLIVGTVAFDAIETPFGKTDKIIGGSAMYCGLSASHLMKEIGIVSIVGDDFPTSFLENFNARGIDTSGVEIKKGEKSFFWSGKYHNDMNSRDTLVTDLNVLTQFNPEVPNHLRNPDFLMLGNVDPTLQMKVIDQIPNRPKMVMLDTMNFWMDKTPNELNEVIKKIDILSINDEEARQLSGEYSLVTAYKRIREMGPKILIVKKGEHGALIFKDKDVFFAPALPLEVVFDPTGAGDSFAGGIMGYLAKTRDISFNNLKRSVIYGSALASLCVEKFGPERLLELSNEELSHRLQDFVNLVQVDISIQ